MIDDDVWLFREGELPTASMTSARMTPSVTSLGKS